MPQTTNQDLEQLAFRLRELAENVRAELGCGFDEHILQNAFAIELRDNDIEYLKEVNIEIFYKKQYVGVDRPDFVITKVGGCSESIILDLKLAKGRAPSTDDRAQLQSYCTSFPLNNNPVLTNFSGGILLIFPKGDVDNTGRVKLFIVNRKSIIIRDEQKEELDAEAATTEAAKREKQVARTLRQEAASQKKAAPTSGE